MDNSGKIEAYKSFYAQAKEMYNGGDIVSARELFLKAASLANDIYLTSTSVDVRMEYHKLAERILAFVRKECSGKKVVTDLEPSKKKDEEVFTPKAEKSDGQVTFSDVAGLEDVKDQIRFKVIAPMKDPELAKRFKVNAGGKILLYGPPGTGKTFIAKAIAGEVDAVFYAISCQDLISKYMGDSSKQLVSLFDEAQKNERAIIFFDEFDSVASKRSDGGGGVDEEMSRFVASFLTLVDGFKKSKTCKMLLLIAATNRPWTLDSAMLRGGRFDTQIYVGMPDLSARRFLVNKAFEDIPLDIDVDLEKIANVLDGYGGGDIVSICEKIRLEAYKRSILSGMEQNISRDDCNAILSNLKNNVTLDDMNKFELYKTTGSI